MSSTKKHDGSKWQKFGSTKAVDIKITDFSGNFESDNVEGALREASSKISDIQSSVDGQKDAIKKHSADLQQHAEDIAYLKEHGGGGGGGNIAPTITSKFEDGTIVDKGKDVIIPIFFSSPNLGNGTAYIVIDGIEVNSVSVKAGNNNVNIGPLPNLHNEVSIYVKDRIGMLSNQLTWNIIAGGIDLTVNFDSNADYGVTDTILMQFNVTAAGTDPIIMHMTIDYDTYEVQCDQGHNEYIFTGLGVGIHKVSFYITSGNYKTGVTAFNIVVVNAESLYVSSTFEGGKFDYGVPIPIQYRISKMGSEVFDVRLEIDDELDKSLSVSAGTYYWTLNDVQVGVHTYAIKVSSAYGEYAEVTGSFEVVEGEYTPLKIIQSGLIYRLSAKGRTNNDSDRSNPRDNSGNGVNATLHNFNYFSNGWIDDTLVCDGNAYVEIDTYPWSENAIYGSTIEIQFKGLDIGIFGARIFDYTDIETPYKGAYIDLEETTMKSLANTGKINIDADAWITISFVIDRKNKFGKIYVDGICSRAFSLSDTGSGTSAIREDFSHMQKIYLNSRKGIDKFGACEIKDVRVYSRVLSDDEIVQNTIAQIEDLAEQKRIYDLNYNNTTLPTIKMYGDTTNMTLETPVTMRVKYTSPNEDKYGQSFDLPYCQVNWQGTSSLQYVLKNFTVRLKDENMADYYYTPYPNGVPETTFCFKCDYMESTHSRNTGLAKFVNDCLYDEKNPAQLVTANVRNSVDGFPVLMYINDELQGVYNFNLDRYSTQSYGYTKDTTLVYEVSANSDTTAGAFYKWSEDSGKSKLDYYKSDFECLYPPTRAAGNDDMAELINLVEWVNDSSDEEFKDNITNHFNLQYLLRYFLYVYVAGAVDSLGKNMKLTTWDGLIWYPQVYDADTTIGLDNTGFLKFDMDIEMGDENVFNTTGSKLWKRVQLLFDAELKEQYALMRQKQFTVENLMKYILEEQILKIPATFYNKDMQTKYLNYGSSYLYALHGSGEHHIRKWLRERLIYCDTLFGYNVSTSDYITLRSSKLGYVYLDIQTYIPMYVRVKWRDEANNTGVQVKRVARGETVRFEYNMPTATDQEIIVYAGYYLKSLGDVSNLQPTSMLIANASRLTEIECHSPNLINTDLSECTKLQRIDLSDSVLLGTGIGAQPILNIQKCKYLRYCNCSSTQLTAIYTMQQGGNLEELYFPETTQVVQVTNQTYLKVLGIPYGYNDILKGAGYHKGMTWNFGYWPNQAPNNMYDERAFATSTQNFSLSLAYNPIKIDPNATYKGYVIRNAGYVKIYEFNADGIRVNQVKQYGIVSHGQNSFTYKPETSDVCYILVAIYGNWQYDEEFDFRMTKIDEYDTFKYCKNLANVQITNCNAIEYIQYPYKLGDDLNFDSFRYVQNLTITNSLNKLTQMSFSGFSKLRGVTLSSLSKLERLGFDDMLLASEVSTIKNVTISDCPLVDTVSFNVSSNDHKVEFATNGVIDISGLPSCRTIESNYSIKGLNKIILPLTIKNVYLSSDYGDGDNQLTNLWSSTANGMHDSDGFTGIDFIGLDLENFRMEGCSNLTTAINFFLTPVNELPNLSAFESLQGWVNFDRYVGDVRYMFKGINFTFENFQVIFNQVKTQTDITGLFQNAIITKAQFDPIIAKFPNAKIFDYFLNGSTIEEDYEFPVTATSVVGAFKDCLNMTAIHSNWKTEYTDEIAATDCYKGCESITHMDGEEVYIDASNTPLDGIPKEWGGYGFTKDVTGIYELILPTDNYFVLARASTNYDTIRVNWGDGTITTGTLEHTYDKAGTYIVKGELTWGGGGAGPNSELRTVLTKVIQYPTTGVSSMAFANCTALETVNLSGLEPDTLYQAFYNCTNLRTINGLKVTNKCTNMYAAFKDSTLLETVQYADTWDVSNVSTLNNTFNNCGLTDYSFITNWSLNSCTSTNSCFMNTKAAEIDLSGWYTPKLAGLSTGPSNGGLFQGSTIQRVNVTGLVTSVTKDIGGMFNGCRNLTEIIGMDTWDTSNVTAMEYMFQNIGAETIDISNWVLNNNLQVGYVLFQTGSKVTTLIMNNVRWNKPELVNNIVKGDSRTIINYQTNNITTVVMDTINPNMTNFDGIFKDCNKLTHDIILPSWTKSCVNAFNGCSAMTHVHSNWDGQYAVTDKNVTWVVGQINTDVGNASFGKLMPDYSTMRATDFIEFKNTIYYEVGVQSYFSCVGYDENKNPIGYYIRSAGGWKLSTSQGYGTGTTVYLDDNLVDIQYREEVKYIRITNSLYEPEELETIRMYDNIPSSGCYSGCTAIVNVDGEDQVITEVYNPLDIIPKDWGGYGWDKDNTAIIVIETPNDNYTFVSSAYSDDIFAFTTCKGAFIDWGDGTTNDIINDIWTTPTHTYATAGRYIIKGNILVSRPGYGGHGPATNCVTEILQYPTKLNVANNGFAGSMPFTNFGKLTKCIIRNNKHLSSQVFQNCNKLEYVDISGSTIVEQTSSMFNNCHSLTTIKADNVKFDNVIRVEYMFNNAPISDINFLKDLDVSGITNFSSMFRGTKITDITPLQNWDMSSATNLSAMFASATLLEDFNPIAGWNVHNVMKIDEFLPSTAATNIDFITNWRLDSVESIGSFARDTNVSDLSPLLNRNLDKVTNMVFLADMMPLLESIDARSLRNCILWNHVSQYCENMRTLILPGNGVYEFSMHTLYAKNPVSITYTNETPKEVDFRDYSFPWGAVSPLPTYQLTFENTIITNINSNSRLYEGTQLTVESLLSLLNALKDYSGTDTTKTLRLSSASIGKLTDEQKAIAINKGWTLTTNA